MISDRMTQAVDADEARPLDMLFAETYGELRKLAGARLRGGYGDTFLTATELVHESYLRLAGAVHLDLKDRVHFLCYAGTTMRSIIVDYVRRRNRSRHGGEAGHVELDTEISGEANTEAEQVRDALEDLAKFDSRMVRVVELRYFAGMTEAETAEVLAVTDRTVRREWEKARVWLAKALS